MATPNRSTAIPIQHQSFQTQRPTDILTIVQSRLTGLTNAEATERFLRDGPNEVQRTATSWVGLLGRQYLTPLVGLLAVAAAISLFLGEVTDGILVIAIIVANGLLGFGQEYRSHRSLRSLDRFFTSTCSVLRDGTIKPISPSELVRGDVVVLQAGDRVPADLRLIESRDLLIDESTLTGESDAVQKDSHALHRPTASLTDNRNLVFGGSFIRHGQGRGVVIATAGQTILGDVATLVAATQRVSSFELQLRSLSRFLIALVSVALTAVVVVNLATKGESIDFAQQLLFAMALAVSVIPEALPAVTTITLARGAVSLTKRHVVVKRLTAIEDLGAIDVLCTDKTGTLTENRPTVARIISNDRHATLGLVLSAIPPSVRSGGRENGDPFDQAILDYARAQGIPIRPGSTIDELPFDAERRRVGTLVKTEGQLTFIVRGAPESVLALCQNLTPAERRELLDQCARLGQAGQRVIAVASRSLTATRPHSVAALEHDLDFQGLIAFLDPIKPSTRRALIEAEHLGVQVKMVTGDSPSVAGAVAAQLGLVRSPLDVVTGDQLSAMSPAEYRLAVHDRRVFARMTPRQKFEVIRTLEETNTVGFLGEGINDAPALKLASVSLVVQGASDIARDAADIVLLEKSLNVIIDGIKHGRSIYANVSKYVKYTLVGNVGNFFAIAGISLITDFLPMLPIQILLTNILTDFPLIAVAGDSVDAREVRRPPQFHLRELGFMTLLLGLVSSLFDFIFFGLFRTSSPATIQTLWFSASILTELALIFSLRTTLPFHLARPAAPLLAWLAGLAGLTALLLPLLPIGQSLFRFIQPTPSQLFTIVGLVAAYFIATEAVKQAYYASYRNHPRRA